LNVLDWPTAESVTTLLDDYPYEEAVLGGRIAYGLPFVPIGMIHDPRQGWVWNFRCTELQPDGRCGIYDRRPYSPCVVYEPGQDGICAHHVPKIGLCGELKQDVKPPAKVAT
jgi:Fe-S-cluster containining protein